MWGKMGVSATEFRCRLCKFPVHSKCRESAESECNCEEIPITTEMWQLEVQKQKKSGATGGSSGVDASLDESMLAPIRMVSQAEMEAVVETTTKSLKNAPVEVVRVTVVDVPWMETFSLQGTTKTLQVRPTTTIGELEAQVRAKVCAMVRTEARTDVRRQLEPFRLFDPGDKKHVRRMMPQEKPYGKIKVMLFQLSELDAQGTNNLPPHLSSSSSSSPDAVTDAAAVAAALGDIAAAASQPRVSVGDVQQQRRAMQLHGGGGGASTVAASLMAQKRARRRSETPFSPASTERMLSQSSPNMSADAAQARGSRLASLQSLPPSSVHVAATALAPRRRLSGSSATDDDDDGSSSDVDVDSPPPPLPPTPVSSADADDADAAALEAAALGGDCAQCKLLLRQLHEAKELNRRYEQQLEQMQRLIGLQQQGAFAGAGAAAKLEKKAAAKLEKELEEAAASKVLVEYEDLGDRIIMEKVSYNQFSMPEFVLPPADQPFDRAYTPNHALWLAYISALTYGDELAIEKVVREIWCWHDVHFFEDDETNTRALGIVHEQFVVVAFRGTESVENWNTNLNFSMKPLDGTLTGPYSRDIDPVLLKKVRVHKGFNQALMTVWPDVERFVDEHAGMPLYITGHSLGGALATLAWLYLTLRDRQVQALGITTFGQPRAGNKALRELLENHAGCVLQRVCNRGDIVPSLPPTKPYHFKHCGLRVFITQAGDLSLAQKTGTERLQRMAGSLGASGVSDHKQYNYINAVQKHFDRSQKARAGGAGTGGMLGGGGIYRGQGYKCRITVVRGVEMARKLDVFVLLRRSSMATVGSDLSLRTAAVRGPEPVWNEQIEIPEVYRGEEAILEVWADNSCRGCVILQWYEFASTDDDDMIEFPLQSRPGKKDKGAGVSSIFLAIKFSPLTEQAPRRHSFNASAASSLSSSSSLVGGSALLLPLASSAGASGEELMLSNRLFGVSLSALMERQQRDGFSETCPVFLARTTVAIIDNALHVRGAFEPEAPPNPAELSAFKMLFNEDPTHTYRKREKPELVVALFFYWLRSLREPLFGWDNYMSLYGLPLVPSVDARIKAARHFCSRMEPWQRSSVAHIACMIEQLAQNEPFTKRALDRLACSLAPYLLFTKHPKTSEPLHVLEHQERCAAAVTFVMQHWRDVLGDDVAKRLPEGFGFDSFGPASPRFEFAYKLVVAGTESASGVTCLHRINCGDTQWIFAGNRAGTMALFSLTALRYESTIELPDCESFGRVTGVWDLGRTPAAKALSSSNTWVVAFDAGPLHIIVPQGSTYHSKPVATTQGHFTCGTQSPDGALYFGSNNGSVVRFEVGTSDHCKMCLPKDPERRILAIACVPATREVFAADSHGAIHVISLATNKPAGLVAVSPDSVSCTAMLVADSHLWFADRHGMIYVVDVVSRHIIYQFERGVPATSLAFLSRPSPFVISGASDGQVEVWDATTFVRCAQFTAHTDTISSIVVTRPDPYSDLVVLWVASADRTCSVWRCVGMPSAETLQRTNSRERPTSVFLESSQFLRQLARTSSRDEASPPRKPPRTHLSRVSSKGTLARQNSSPAAALAERGSPKSRRFAQCIEPSSPQQQALSDGPPPTPATLPPAASPSGGSRPLIIAHSLQPAPPVSPRTSVGSAPPLKPRITVAIEADPSPPARPLAGSDTAQRGGGRGRGARGLLRGGLRGRGRAGSAIDGRSLPVPAAPSNVLHRSLPAPGKIQPRGRGGGAWGRGFRGRGGPNLNNK
jgi:triacylglycerol lipase